MSTRSKATPGCSGGSSARRETMPGSAPLSWMTTSRRRGSRVGSATLARSCSRSARSGWYVTMLMSTSRIEDLLEEPLADGAGEQVERFLVDAQLHVFLAEGAALLDLRGELGLQARDVGLEL